MNQIRNIFGKVNIFVRGTFNYVLGNSSEDEDEKYDQEKVRETENAVGQNQVGHSKSNSQVKRKRKGKKKSKKKAKRNRTPSKIHPRQKQITVKIPEGPQPFNTGNLFKVPSRSHTQIDCSSAAKAKKSNELIISEKTMHLENAIKFGNKAEAIDVKDDEFSKQPHQKKEQGSFLPSIVVKQENKASDSNVLANRADTKETPKEGAIRNISKKQNKLTDVEVLVKRDDDTNKSLKGGLGNILPKPSTKEFHSKIQNTKTMDEDKSGLRNILPLSCKKDEIKKPSTKEFHPKIQNTKTMDEDTSGLRNILPLSNKKDEIKKLSIVEFKPKTQDTRIMDENKSGRQEDKVKLPDIHSCHGSLVSQPISCPDRNQPMAMAFSKKPTDKRPSLAMVQKNTFLSTLETIQEKVEEKYFNSQSLTQTGGINLEKVAELVAEDHNETSEVCKRDYKGEASDSRLAETIQATEVQNKSSPSEREKRVVKDDSSVEALEGQAALENTAVKKKSKKQKNKKNKKSKANKDFIDEEEDADESLQQGQGTGMKLNPIIRNGKSPLERLREVESKLLAQKHLQLGKVFSRNNKVAPLRTEIEELGVSKKNDLQFTHQESSTGASEAAKPLRKSLKSERSHIEKIDLPTSLSAMRVPEVLPTPSALPRILPRCKSPKIFTKAKNREQTKNYSYRCARPNLTPFTYEPSDEEEEQLVSSSRSTATAKTKKMDSHTLLSPFTYEPSDDEEQKVNLVQATTPKRKFSVQDRLRMGRKVMSSEKKSKYQATKAGAGVKASTTGLPRGIETRSSIHKEFMLPSTPRYSAHHQQTRNLLPSLDPQGKDAIAKEDDLKIMELFGIEDGNQW